MAGEATHPPRTLHAPALRLSRGTSKAPHKVAQQALSSTALATNQHPGLQSTLQGHHSSLGNTDRV